MNASRGRLAMATHAQPFHASGGKLSTIQRQEHVVVSAAPIRRGQATVAVTFLGTLTAPVSASTVNAIKVSVGAIWATPVKVVRNETVALLLQKPTQRLAPTSAHFVSMVLVSSLFAQNLF
jgi:hypothetical protein